MARKKDVYKVKPITEGKKNIISDLLNEYDIKSAEDVQEALKGPAWRYSPGNAGGRNG